MKDTAVQLLTEQVDQLKRWFEHHQYLSMIRQDITRVKTEVPPLQEIETAIRGMNLNRDPRVDHIPADMLKADPVVSAQQY